MKFSSEHSSLEAARLLDQKSEIQSRGDFVFPTEFKDPLYFAGHSLGLMPKKAKDYINEELDSWSRWGVEGHFHGKHPWLPYHENLSGALSRLVGAKSIEVVAMNSLTVNLHLMMVSFYRPTAKKFKILIENNTFPSDKYAVDSQARFHGFKPEDAIVELRPRAGQMCVSAEDILQQIEDNKDSLALVMLGNCNYLSGQQFPFEKITDLAHRYDIKVGFNLAHGAGNLYMQLHDWCVDFAVWCSYKYLNAGPGGIAGAFVHERHLGDKNLPRFSGWWGHDKSTRFQMGPQFSPIPTVEAWQLSNPPIFQLASLRASMDIFDRYGMQKLRTHSESLTGYLEFLLKEKCRSWVSIVTPENSSERGSMLCVRIQGEAKVLLEKLKQKNVILDFRSPDILRMTPVALYNTHEDVFRLVSILEEAHRE